MAKQRDPLRDEAKRLFDESGGSITNREIAARLGTDEKKVAVWKARDGWTAVQQKKLVQQTAEVQQKKAAKKADKKLVKAAAENTELTEQQITFCLLYVKTFNATQSYMKAYCVDYRTAHSYGYTQLQRPEILAEIKRLQAVKNAALLVGAADVVELHMRIAFADMTDFFEFKGMCVLLKDSSTLDGQLIDSVKETNNGISIKLADRQKSLAFLERYFLMNPMDKHKQAFDDAKLELERRKAQIEASSATAGAAIIPDAVWRELMNPAYADHLTDDRPLQIYFGGSSSGKSYGILGQRTVRDMLRGERNYLVLRKTARTIRNSCYNEIVKCIKRMELADQFSINKTDMVITHKASGHQILFAGLDDVEKVKSITPAVGVVTDIAIEEATEIEYDDFKSLEKRLRGLCEVPKRMTLLFNPVTQDHWIYTEFFVGKFDDEKGCYFDGNLGILRTTYKDNRFLAQEDIDRLENETDKYYYDVYTLGRWGVLGHLIFTNWEVRDLSEQEKTEAKPRNGLDFGFFPDPNAFIRCSLNKRKKEVYVYRSEGANYQDNQMLSEMLKPIVQHEVVVCDNDMLNVQELNNFGIRAIPARKGPDSVLFGIKFLRRMKIIIDPRCAELIREMRMYKYREDRNGNILPEPVDRDNHYIDALRYALESDMLEVMVR